MAKSSRVARQRAERAAAALRREREARRNRFLWAGGAVGVVLVVVLTLVVVKLTGGGSTGATPQTASATAAPEIVQAVTDVPSSVLEKVGLGKVDALPKAISGQPALTAGGKPLVVYIGAEYCPFCAAQRWGMVVALSRFGSFSGLKTTTSASDDVYPNTATLSFHGTTFTSDYLTFQGVETSSNVRQGNTYAPLDTLTDQQNQVIRTYNAPPYVAAESAGSIPFIDFGNKFLATGSSVSPQLMAGKSAQDIATALSDPSSPLAQAILGSANAFTAAICQVTGGQPSAVCTSPAVTAYQGKLNAG